MCNRFGSSQRLGICDSTLRASGKLNSKGNLVVIFFFFFCSLSLPLFMLVLVTHIVAVQLCLSVCSIAWLLSLACNTHTHTHIRAHIRICICVYVKEKTISERVSDRERENARCIAYKCKSFCAHILSHRQTDTAFIMQLA